MQRDPYPDLECENEPSLLSIVQKSLERTLDAVSELKVSRERLGIYAGESAVCAEDGECIKRPVPDFIQTWDAMPEVLVQIARDVEREVDLLDQNLIKDQRPCGEEACEKLSPLDHIEKVADGMRKVEFAMSSLDRFVSRLLSNEICGELKNACNPSAKASFRDIWEELPKLFDYSTDKVLSSTLLLNKIINDSRMRDPTTEPVSTRMGLHESDMNRSGAFKQRISPAPTGRF